MVIRSGDLIAISVMKSWAASARAGDVLRHLSGDDTLDSQMYAGRLLSLTDSVGLWVESPPEEKGVKKRSGPKFLIPWGYILAIRSVLFEAGSFKIGFNS